MQNSNLSSKIFPIIKDAWSLFIKRVEKDYQKMLTTYKNDNQRTKDLVHLTNRLKEAVEKSKDNIAEILNYRDLFVYIDKSLESSFDALNYFKEQKDMGNSAVKSIYEKIITSAQVMAINSEYSRLSIQVHFDNERIKKLSELIHGGRIDFSIIRELLDKYKFDDNTKKNILFYPIVMLSVKQNEVKKTNPEEKKKAKQEFYRERFNELVKIYQDKKESLKDLLVRCFNVRAKMERREVDMYGNFASNPEEAMEYDFDEENMFKIYTLAFFKIKKDIENYIDGISDLIMDSDSLDDELVFFNAVLDEFDSIANRLNSLVKEETEEEESEVSNNVFFALDPFNRVIIGELLNDKNMSSIKALLQKMDNVINSKFEGVKTTPVQGVEEAEKLLGKNISMIITSKFKLAYVMVNKNILIIGGTDGSERFDRLIRLIVKEATYTLKKQIALIENEDIDYIERQKEIIANIMGEPEKII